MHLPLDTCSVTIHRRKQRAFIALGSNMGDKQANLKQAIEKMRARGIHILKGVQCLDGALGWCGAG